MSITIKCDFCGKIYESRAEMLNISVWQYGASTKKGGKKIERMDYCKGCWNKLKHTAPNSDFKKGSQVINEYHSRKEGWQ